MTDRPDLTKNSSTSTASPGDKPAPPQFVRIAALALLVSGLFGLIASGTNFIDSVKSSVRDTARDSIADSMLDKFDEVKKAGPSTGGTRAADLNALQSQIRQLKGSSSDSFSAFETAVKSDADKLKPGASAKGKTALNDLDKQAENVGSLNDQVTNYQKVTLVSSLIVLIALGLAARAVYRGKSWARWAPLGIWVLATFTGALAGLGSVMSIGADLPILFKVPAFIAGLSLVVAVVLTNLRPSVNYFNLSRPDRGARPQRRGLFSPPAARTAAEPVREKPAAGSAGPDRARTKARSSEAAVAKGAELARSRAKASKSRRTGA